VLLVLAAGEAGAAAMLQGPPPDLYVVSRGPAAEALALALARRCRWAGLAVELDLSGAAFGKQFKRADRCGARWAAVIGEAEAAEGVAQLKNLRRPGESAALGGQDPELRLNPDGLIDHLLASRPEAPTQRPASGA
jgi:histidyl-tRNA synthetase